MKSLLVVCATVLLIQTYLETVAALPTYQITKNTQYKFTIDHSLVLSYTNDLQRDAILQKIFAFWKTVLSKYHAANLSIQLLQTADGLDAGSHIVQYRVAGDSAVEISLEDVTSQYEQQLPSAGISGVRTLSSLSAGSDQNAEIQGARGLISYTVDIDSFLSYRTPADRDRILQRILDLWRSIFASNQFIDLQIKFLSEKPSNIPGAKQVSYRVTGKSQGEVDIQSLVSVFLPALQSAGVSGVVVPTGGAVSGATQNNWIIDSYLTYKSSPERDQLLQQILNLWKNAFSSYQLSDLSISAVKEDPTGTSDTKLVTYKITGRSQRPTDNADLSAMFLSSLKSSQLPGVQVVNPGNVRTQQVVVPPNGDSNILYSFAVDVDAILNVGSRSESDDIKKKILNLFKTNFASNGYSGVKITVLADKPSSIPGVRQTTYRISGSSNQFVDIRGLLSNFLSILQSSELPGIQFINHDTDISQANAQLVAGQQIQEISPSGGGSWQYNGQRWQWQRNGAGNVATVPLDTTAATASRVVYIPPVSPSTVIATPLIVNVQDNGCGGMGMIQSQSMNGGGMGQGQSIGGCGDYVLNQNGNYGGLTENNWIIDSYFTYKTPAERDQLLQQILNLWKTVFASYQLGDLSISVVKEGPSGIPGAKLVTYKINGKSRSAIDSADLTTRFLSLLASSPLSGVQVLNSGNSRTQIVVPTDVDSNILYSFAVDVDAILNVGSRSESDDIKKKILNLFKTNFASNGYSDIKITVLADKPSSIPGSRQTTYRITGSSNQFVDISSLLSNFLSILQSAELPGVQFSNHFTNIDQTPNFQTAAQDITIDNDVILNYETPAHLNQLLQQILDLWKNTVGSVNRFTNLRIKMISSRPNGSGGRFVTYRIEGNSDTPFDWNQYKLTFESAMKTAQFPKFVSVDSVQETTPVTTPSAPSGGGSWQYNGQSWQWQLNGATSVLRASPDTPATTASAVVYIPSATSTTTLATSTTTATTIPSFIYDTNRNRNNGGQEINIDGNVILTYNTPAQLNQLLQQILNLWKTTVGPANRFTNLTIRMITSRPNGSGGTYVTYRIGGSSDSPFDWSQYKVAFESAIKAARFPNTQSVDSVQETATDATPSGGGSWQWQLSGGGSVVSTSPDAPAATESAVVYIPAFATTTTSATSATTPTTTTLLIYDANQNRNDGDLQIVDVSGVGKYPIGSGPVSGGGSSFNIEDQVLVHYASPEDRNVLLQRLLAFWKTVFSTSQLANVKIEFLQDQPSADVQYRTVYYRVTGQSAAPIDNSRAIITFNQALQQNKPIANVIVATKNDAISTTGSSIEEDVPTTGNQFDLRQSVNIQYTSSAERDRWLQEQILGMWKYAFNQYQDGGVSVTFVSEKPAPNIGPNFNRVTYRVNGFLSPEGADVSTARSTYRTALYNAQIPQLKDVEDKSSAGQISTGGASVDYNDVVVLRYTTDAQRNALLQRLLDLFKTTFSSYQLNSLKIVYVNDQVQPDGSRKVFFKITGQSGQQFDYPSAVTQFQSAVTAQGDSNIQSSSSIRQDSPRIPFDYTQKVHLAYDIANDRDEFVKRLGVIWRNILHDYVPYPDFKLVYVSEKKNVGKLPETTSSQTRNLNEVTYRLTGATQRPFNIDDLNAIFRQTVQDAHLAGVMFDQSWATNSDGAVAVTGLPFKINNSAYLTYSGDSERDALLARLLSLFQTTFTSYQLSNVKIAYDHDVEGPAGSRQVYFRITGNADQAVDVSLTSRQLQSAIQNANINGIQAMNTVFQNTVVDFTDSIVLSYSTSAQRDTLLKRILNRWKTVLAQYQVSNLKISYVSDTNAKMAGRRIVKYRITGSRKMEFSLQEVVNLFIASLQNSPINGVTLLANDIAAPVGVTSGQVQPSLGPNLVGGNGQQFTIPGSVALTYRNEQQRQTFLDQILVMWRNTIWDSLVADVAIKMTSESGSGQTKTVNYVITGTSTNPIDVDAARVRFSQLLSDANLTGVQPVDTVLQQDSAQGPEQSGGGQGDWTDGISDSS